MDAAMSAAPNLKENKMFKITTKIVNNQWSVVVTSGTDERLHFSSALGLHTAEAAADSLRRDVKNHGEIIEFENLPVIKQRISQSGKPVRFTE